MTLPRVVCLSPDAVTTFIDLEAEACIVGRPSGTRHPEMKGVPCIGSYGRPSIEKILACAPDIAVGYSDFHAPLTAELVSRHISVVALNHTSIEGIFAAVGMLAGLVRKCALSEKLIAAAKRRLADLGRRPPAYRPSVYFEEWPTPATCGPLWISELIFAAGGNDVFADQAKEAAFQKRRVTTEAAVRGDPEVIFASWCGKPFEPEQPATRPGWGEIRAVQRNNLFSLPGRSILQPNLHVVEGAETMHRLIARAAAGAI